MLVSSLYMRNGRIMISPLHFPVTTNPSQPSFISSLIALSNGMNLPKFVYSALLITSRLDLAAACSLRDPTSLNALPRTARFPYRDLDCRSLQILLRIPLNCGPSFISCTMASPGPSSSSSDVPVAPEDMQPTYQPDSAFFEALMRRTSEYQLNPDEDRAVQRAWFTFRGGGWRLLSNCSDAF